MINELNWQFIPGYEDLYKISIGGQIFSQKSNRLLTPSPDKDGYLRVTLFKSGSRLTLKVHRLVSIAFISNPQNKPQVNHKNGIKTDNRIENLEWCDTLYNTRHAIKLGLFNPLGDGNGRSKLTSEEVLQARSLYDSGNFTARQVNELLGNKVDITIMGGILSGKYWKHLPGNGSKKDPYSHMRQLTIDQERELIILRKKGFKQKDLAKQFNVSERVVRRTLLVRSKLLDIV